MHLIKDKSDIDRNLFVEQKNLNITRILNRIRGGNSRESLDRREGIESSIFDLVPDGILVSSLTGFILATNNAYLKLTGYSKDEVVGKHALQIPALKNIEEVDEYWTHISKVFRGDDIQGFEFKYRHADGSIRWGEARASISKRGMFRGEAIAVLRDITERKQREEELQRLMENLERSNRELDDYTYAVSHDLKAPLRTIGSFASFLLEDYSEKIDEVGKGYILRMHSASLRMTELIDDLLLISRVGRTDINIEFFDMNAIISEIIDDNKSMLNDKNGKIIAGELPSIQTQKVWVKQIFANLVNNGLKFNESSNPTVWIECEEKEDHYLFSVKDNGIGIEKKYNEKIFKMFQRLHTSEEYPGTGAGLTLVKKVLESFGGSIRLESKVGKGTVFYITIPIEKVRPEDSEPLIHVEDDQIIV